MCVVGTLLPVVPQAGRFALRRRQAFGGRGKANSISGSIRYFNTSLISETEMQGLGTVQLKFFVAQE